MKTVWNPHLLNDAKKREYIRKWVPEVSASDDPLNDLNVWPKIEKWLEQNKLLFIYAAHVAVAVGACEPSGSRLALVIRAAPRHKAYALLQTLEMAVMCGKFVDTCAKFKSNNGFTREQLRRHQ